jgi:hypothetical protein
MNRRSIISMMAVGVIAFCASSIAKADEVVKFRMFRPTNSACPSTSPTSWFWTKVACCPLAAIFGERAWHISNALILGNPAGRSANGRATVCGDRGGARVHRHVASGSLMPSRRNGQSAGAWL